MGHGKAFFCQERLCQGEQNQARLHESSAMAEYSSKLELCSFGLTKSFLKVQFLAMAKLKQVWLCSFGLTKSLFFENPRTFVPHNLITELQ